ncbi:HesA/MoeB/ThiF family protein [Reinekea sp.]|jgi:adenylyltransferase/sulfurtransferase|uniref:HesA/MoeB/ThiF family protein n=1 Tax=Reinekea sp. TaxID=1970455 RepID=UPI002A7ECF6E|nr:HesA/MoeB/ThiF family protein [Reinekea sp.]
MIALTDDQLLRYARNILLPEVDVIGQATLLASHVAVIGVGGLGSPVIQYLAAAGVGHLSLVDDDVVEVTNLQRQIIHDTSQIGIAKVASAQAFIRRLNPEVQVSINAEALTSANGAAILQDVDLVVIGTDNFASRYLANTFCQQLQIPLVSGAAIGTSGQVSSFDFARQATPCFECLYPKGQDEQLSCASAGVLGPVVGTIGSIMALEVIKILLHIGQPLFGRLLTWDARVMDWQTFNYGRAKNCPCCTETPL